jgi:cytochrome c oxidase cbb3-type subunit 3/ubiquinol-cytochrome c reductase cytochrome c subunit
MRVMSLRSRVLPLLVLLPAACSGAKQDHAHDAAAAPPKVVAGGDAAPPKVALSRVEEGAKLWETYCALCHGAEAKGYAADHAPSLVSPTFLATASDVFLRSSIALGRPGTSMAAYGKSRGGPLADDDILKIIAWVRSLHTIDAVHPEMPRTGNAAKGQPIYDKTCKQCHGDPKARGEQVWLANPTFLELAPDAFLRHAIINGRPDTPMIAFGGTLSPPEIDDVVAYLRSWAKSPNPGGDSGPPPPPPLDGPIVMNPKGKAPEFHLREERFAPAAEVKQAYDEKRKMIIVDARAPSDWSAMHIPGAISIPYYAMDEIDKLPNDGTWVLTYCACPHHASGVVLDELRKRGFPNTAIIDEGILFWQQQNYPIEVPKGAAPPPTPKLPGADGKPVP